MHFFVSHWRVVDNEKMPAMRIIPSFNVGEDSQARFLMRTERSAIDQLTFQGGEEALTQYLYFNCSQAVHVPRLCSVSASGSQVPQQAIFHQSAILTTRYCLSNVQAVLHQPGSLQNLDWPIQIA